MAIKFHDEDMRRAWEQAGVEEVAAAKNPERTSLQRRRLIAWVAARTAE